VGHLPREVDTTTSLNEKSLFDKDDDVADADHPPSMTQEVPTPSDEEDAGTTAIVVLLTPKWIVCANSGDSRAIYSKSNHRAVPLSYDHKPEDEDEERRIREAGGFVSGGRVEGDLAVSRGLGDFRFKDMHVVLSGSRGENRDRREVTFGNNDSHDDADEVVDAIPLPACKPSEQKVSPVPDIIVQNRDGDEDEFVVIACDGIWDVQTNQECVQMVADIFSEGESDIGLVCEEVSLEK
jgi:serine/threonine protein phosphatase PrpC